MKTTLKVYKPLSLAAMLVACSGNATADIVLGGPGMAIGSYKLTQMQDQVQVNLGTYYKYEVHGYYGRIDAGVPVDGWVHNNGKLYSNSTPQNHSGPKQGHSCLINTQVNVENSLAGDPLQMSASDIRETTGDLVVGRSSVLKLEDQVIRLGFRVEGNVQHPSGYLVVMGVGIKQPPKPSGELTVPIYAEAFSTPNVGWCIARDVTSEESNGHSSTLDITLPDYKDTGNPSGSGNNSNSAVDDGWKGDGKSNNGHGNNADGVDVSNPGKGKGGPNGKEDTDYDGDGTYEDDEIKGGGAKPGF